MPVITTVPSENREDTSQSMCAVVKGYPLVIRNSDDPKGQWGIPFDSPMFHWYIEEDQKKQLIKYMKETFSVPGKLTEKAVEAGNKAQKTFQEELKKREPPSLKWRKKKTDLP